jgi:hypothetical protein
VTIHEVSLFQWLGPHLSASFAGKPNQTIGRARRYQVRESHIPEWLQKAKAKQRSLIGVQGKRCGDG